MAGRRTVKTAVVAVPVDFHDRVAGLLSVQLGNQIAGVVKSIEAIKVLSGNDNAMKAFDAAMQSLGGKGSLKIRTSGAQDSKGANVRRSGARKKKTISEAGKQAIRAAQLKRWAKIKRAGKRSAKKS